MSTAKRKLNVVTLEKKLHELKRVDKGQSLKSICTDLDVGRSTLADWIKIVPKLSDGARKWRVMQV